jgi:glycerol-3-phosphate acyltransferase PlsY
MGSVVATLILLPTSVLLWDGWAGVVFAVGLSALVLWRHRRNIRAFLLERSGG